MDTVVLAFYKANNKHATMIDKLVALWTKGPYSHVELVYKSGNAEYGISADYDTNKVRKRVHVRNYDRWEYMPLQVESLKHILEFYELVKDDKYDFLGIFLSQILPLGVDANNRWFCSEFVTKALLIGGVYNRKLWLYKPEYVSPNKLARIVGLLDKKMSYLDTWKFLNRK